MVLLFLGRSWWASIIFKPYRALPLYSRTEPHCRLPCQTSAKNIGLNSIATCAIMVPCCADIERNRSKKGDFFLQETMPCIHGPSVCVCVCACVYTCTRGSCVKAYDYECAGKLSASLFLESQKQAFLASWLRALIVCVCVYACSPSSCVDRIL